jgi:hypothetical protein
MSGAKQLDFSSEELGATDRHAKEGSVDCGSRAPISMFDDNRAQTGNCSRILCLRLLQ